MSAYGARTVRVYLLDDHQIVRQGLRELVATARDIEVLGDSGSAVRAVAEIARLPVDIALLDLQLQDGSGIDVARAIRSADARIKVLLLTSASDDDALVASVLAGAEGYVVKVSRTFDIVGSIRRLGSGRRLLDAEALARGRILVEERRRTVVPPLTEDEERLLDEVLTGSADDLIAERLAVGRDVVAAAVSTVAQRITFGARTPIPEPWARPGAGKHRRSD